MGSPSSARHRCRQACSHPITAPAITLTAPQRGLHVTEHTKRSRCPLLDIGSPWRGRTLHTPHPLPHRPVPRARVAAAVLLRPRPAHRGSRCDLTPPPLSRSREERLCRRPGQGQLQRFRPQPQVTEHLADHERVGDLRDHVPPSAAPRAAQDIYTEGSMFILHPAQEKWQPRPMRGPQRCRAYRSAVDRGDRRASAHSHGFAAL